MSCSAPATATASSPCAAVAASARARSSSGCKGVIRHEVPARNDAESSENKIHDDTVARQYGFRGGLVPGVTVYGYLTWLPASVWGRSWLEAGGMTVRLARPVYAGDTVTVTGEDGGGGRPHAT